MAVEVVFANALRQRCLVHRARNLLAKVAQHAQAEVKQAFWQISTTSMPSPASLRATAFAKRYRDRYPAAVACLTDTLPELTCFLRFPGDQGSGTPT
ncbi:MAG TPA: transposase [Actinomycetes bacterium]|nr:transposase [Actinomycetes bacterium]